MGSLQPRLHLKVAQKQILTPGLVQMVSVLALNKLELKEMINQEIMENPILEEFLDEGAAGSEELGEAEEWDAAPADREVLEVLKTNGAEGPVDIAEHMIDLDVSSDAPSDLALDAAPGVGFDTAAVDAGAYTDGAASPGELTGLDRMDARIDARIDDGVGKLDQLPSEPALPTVTPTESTDDPFQDVDFGSFFDDYL